MRTIFIDDEFICHLDNVGGNWKEIETDFFDGKIDEYIEGFRFVPEGQQWTRDDGEVFEGEMIAPHKDFNELRVAQMEFEIKDAEKALAILLGGEV